ncbi:amidohydrolase family protein [Devosia psychrophila]|uniref:5-methylthioadenosine/S-adenosylhomocysteine deaminase n=1 Tax=Devosia psychrophila TaxID=728005 RepID=A0A0F5PUD7_9HYPH|nr:amidohydrolase [Devosia psychrophila]KKC32243.1 amidohydrolase [Devosia psychrophila]SFD33562.1 5-methylthioadenosine/S-adenosylhomocysteine deaminase [Devosia psychrophila]
MTDLIITNAVVVTADGANTLLEKGGVAVSNGKITHIASAETLAAMEGQAKRVIDASGMLLMPGLINTHCHAADSLFRGLVEDLKLEPWLQTVWKAEAAILNPQTTHLGSVLGFAELLLGGVTTVMDMFWYPSETVRAARDVGVRVSTGGIFFDYPGVNGQSQVQREAIAEAFFEEFGNVDDVFPAVLPHGTYTVSPEHLKIAHAIAEKHGGLFCTHVAETAAERTDIETRYGRPVVQHLEQHGLINQRSVFAHCVHLDDAEIEILARRGATVSHNPMSNLKLASGFARVPDMLKAGINVTLGTDGAISGNDLDMWMALRLAATVHKAVARDAEVVTTREALAMVTINGAKALNAADRIGSLEVGKLADMVLLDLKRPHAVPMFDPLTHLVYSTAKSDVRHVFLGGEQVVRDGALTRLDIADTLDQVQALVPRIKASIA